METELENRNKPLYDRKGIETFLMQLEQLNLKWPKNAVLRLTPRHFRELYSEFNPTHHFREHDFEKDYTLNIHGQIIKVENREES